MKRLINLRIALVAALCFILGIVSFREILFGDYYLLTGIVLALLIALVIALCRKSALWRKAVVALAFVLLGVGRCAIYYNVNIGTAVQQTVTISGRVTDYAQNDDQPAYTCLLEDCTDADGHRYIGRILFVSGAVDLSTGDIVTVSGQLDPTYPIKADVNSFGVRNRVFYQLTGSVQSVQKGSLRLDERVRKYIYDTVTAYMPDNSGVMYALLTGDRNAVDETAQWAFDRAGIVHLLAVSGLHVGFISGVLVFCLRRLRLRPWAECLIVTLPLLFYGYICAFSPSVMRAITMLLCAYVAKMLLARYDMLSSLSVAALVTLCVCPFYLYDVGFQLSFLSVLGITTLHAPISRWLVRKDAGKVVRYAADSLLVSLSCILSTALVLLAQGDDVALFGVFVNVLAVPLVSVAFVTGFLGLLPWIFHYILFVSDALLQAVLWFARVIAGVNYATVSFPSAYVAVIFAVVLMFALGGFVRLGKWRKIFYPVCCIAMVASVVVSYIPCRPKVQAYVVHTEADPVVAVLSDSGQAAIVADFADPSAVSEAVSFLRRYRVGNVTLYFSHLENGNVYAVQYVLSQLPIDAAYTLDLSANDNVLHLLAQQGISAVTQRPNSQTGQDIAVRSVFDQQHRGTLITTGGLRLCVAYDSAADLHQLGISADVYIAPRAEQQLSDDGQCTLTPQQSALAHNFGANKYGNFTIGQKGATIQLSFR